MRRALAATALGLSLGFALPTGARAGAILDNLRERGALLCGVNDNGPGLTARDSQGDWTGFYVDLCRAIAAAVLGDGQHIEFRSVSQGQRIEAVRAGAVDVLMGNVTWTLTRDAGTGVRFTGVVLYDEQRFMTWRKLGLADLRTIGAATVCVIGATTSEQNLIDFLGIEHLPLRPKVVQSTEGLYDALVGHQCDLISSDHIALATYRQFRAGDPEDFVLLPEAISREPIGPMVSITDPQWLDIVKWTMFALIVAEEHGVTRANLGTLVTTATDGETRRLLGIEPGMGDKLGLDALWATRAIREVGNYGEIFERHLGRASGVNLPRGLNELWTRGGLIYAPPLR